MKYFRHFIWLIAITLCLNANSQTYINKEWTSSSPVVSNDINRTASLTYQGKLYVTGNIVSGGGDTDVMTIAYGINGDTLWVKTETGSYIGGDDYGVNLTTTPSGDIVVSASVKNNTSNYDYAIYHYNGLTGVLNWSYTWNGVGNGIDIPSAVKTDALGNVYVAGGTESILGTSDFGIIKLSPSGVFSWDKYYDYNDLHDAATDLMIGSKIIVTGGSNASLGDWDIATLKLDPATGAIINSSRSDIPDATIAEAYGMETDSDNNIYITGFALIGANKNIQTIKLDSALNLIWIADFDGGLDDIGNDIGLDDYGNVYVTGSTELTGGRSKAITIKYSPIGDTLWTKQYGNTVSELGAKANKMVVEPNGDVYVVGTVNETGSSAFILFKYNSYGNLMFSEKHDVDSTINNGFEVAVDSNDVYVTGFSSSVGTTNLTSIKYTIKDKDTSFYYNPITNNPIYVKRDLIVSISPSLVNETRINELEDEYWEFSDIFDEGLVTDLNQALDGICQGRDCPITVYRIFKSQHTYDTLSVSRLGDTVRIPKFWSTFVFEFSDEVDITDAANRISNLFPSINYVTYNLVAYLDDEPNDPLYEPKQRSLHSDATGFWDDNHINIEPAWDYEKGKRYIKVGILDGPVDWDHEDFGGADFTKVDGWDYTINESIYTAESGFSEHHGSAVAGIVGAIRDNDMGIAGIAGGSYEFSDDIDSSGVEIIGLNIAMNDFLIVNHIADAVYNSAVYIPISETGFGVHVMNNSWGVSNAPYYGDPINPWFIDTNIVLLREAFHFANRNKVTVVASRGNSGLMQDAGTYHHAYPCNLDDDWILTVGGTGTDGNYHNGDAVFEYSYKTSQGWEIDVSAASCGSHNWTLRGGDEYNTFNGTSASAPHAAGTASLLMSYLNSETPDYSNLAPEDIENILQMTALDTDISGVDSLTGYGIIDAGAAFAQVDKDDFILAHFGTDAFPFSPSLTPYSTNDTITFTERTQNEDDVWFLPNQSYVVNTFQVIATSEHSIIDGQEIIASWARPSSSNYFALFDEDNRLMPRERIELNSVTETEAVMTGYIYQVFDTLGSFVGWLPFDTDNPDNPILMTYSLLIRDTVAVANMDEVELNNTIQVYPNPTNDNQTLVIEFDQPIVANVRLLDINGKIVFNIFNGEISTGRTKFNVELGSLPSSVYFYTVTVEDGEVYRYKIIKN